MDVYPKGTLAPPFTPQLVNAALLAFPASIEHLLPPWDQIPEEHKNDCSGWAQRLFATWFYKGVKELKFRPKHGIDSQAAFDHLLCILSSYQPKYEYKKAAFCFLVGEWFEIVEFTDLDEHDQH